MVDAAPGTGPHLAGDVDGRCVDDVGGAPLARELELGGVAVDRDDRRGAGEPRPGDHLQANAAAADHADTLADADARGVRDRADPGHHAAPQQRRLP